jgi:Flp pilus assembly protein TadG
VRLDAGHRLRTRPSDARVTTAHEGDTEAMGPDSGTEDECGTPRERGDARRRLGRLPSRDRLRRGARGSRPGQAMVEFALSSIVFLMIIFGTIDLGRSIYIFATLHNAVREGARVAKIEPTNTTAIRNRVVEKAPTIGISTNQVTKTCNPCTAGGSVTVRATFTFTAITQELLGIQPITVTISATNTIE